MPFDPSQFDQGASRFSSGSAGAQRGSFSQYLSGGSGLGDYAGQMQTGFKPPAASNAARNQSYADQGEAQNMGQWSSGLGSIATQYGNAAQIGAGGLSAKQQWAQAKDSAKLQKQQSQQNALFSGISSGISLLSGLGSTFSSPKATTASTTSFPSASSWSTKGMFGH